MSASSIQFTFVLLDADRERVQRIVLAAPGPEPVGEAEEVRPRRSHSAPRPAARWTILSSSAAIAERALPAVRLRDVPPPRRLRPIGSPMDPRVQIRDPRSRSAS